MAADKAVERNLKGDVKWLIPATESARAMASQVEQFHTRLQSIKRKSRDRLTSLPESDSMSLDAAKSNFLDSMETLTTSSQEMKRRANHLCLKWNRFKSKFEEACKQGDLTSEEMKGNLKKIEKLLKLCSDCGKQYKEVSEGLPPAIRECLALSECLKRQADIKKSKETDARIAGIGVSAITSVGSVALIAVSGGAAAPLIGAGALYATGLGTATWAAVTAHALRDLYQKFNFAHGEMNTTLRELNSLQELICKLEQQTTELAENIKVGRNREKKVKKALDAKDKKIEMLEKLLRDHGLNPPE